MNFRIPAKPYEVASEVASQYNPSPEAVIEASIDQETLAHVTGQLQDIIAADETLSSAIIELGQLWDRDGNIISIRDHFQVNLPEEHGDPKLSLLQEVP